MPGTHLRPSDDGRCLITDAGAPFFYLADTAWEMVHRCTREQIEHYFADRQSKGFTAVQVVALPEINGLRVPNREGHLPLHDEDPTRPNEDYFQLIDHIVVTATRCNMYVALLPTWGAYVEDWEHPLFDAPRIFNPENAEKYGWYLGDRYREAANIIWLLGGDRPPRNFEPVWRAMARGIAIGVSGREVYDQTLMTYHPRGGQSSLEYLHTEPWLDFNMIQSGHDLNAKPHEMIRADYERQPAKPVINGEPCYEHIPHQLNVGNERIEADTVRRHAWWSMLAGACGHTYGAAEIWQMYTPDVEPQSDKKDIDPFFGVDKPWTEALQYPGATQMGHMRRLFESRPQLTRVPDQSVIVGDPGKEERHLRAARDRNGGYAIVYTPRRQAIEVDLTKLAGSKVHAWWYNPRAGEPVGGVALERAKRVKIEPPESEERDDWVLVLDDAEAGFSALSD